MSPKIATTKYHRDGISALLAVVQIMHPFDKIKFEKVAISVVTEQMTMPLDDNINELIERYL